MVIVAVVGEQKAEEWRAPSWVLKMALTKGKIKKTGEKIENQIDSYIANAFSGMEDEFLQKFEVIVKCEIDALSDINHL